MKTQVSCKWLDSTGFEARIDDHKIYMDLSENDGGKNRGPRPKPLLLAALAGCSGMDIVPILQKMKVALTSFRMEVEGDTMEEHPKYYRDIVIRFYFSGDKLERSKLERAVELSLEKYCGVSAQLKMGIDIGYQIIIE